MWRKLPIFRLFTIKIFAKHTYFPYDTNKKNKHTNLINKHIEKQKEGLCQ